MYKCQLLCQCCHMSVGTGDHPVPDLPGAGGFNPPYLTPTEDLKKQLGGSHVNPTPYTDCSHGFWYSDPRRPTVYVLSTSL